MRERATCCSCTADRCQRHPLGGSTPARPSTCTTWRHDAPHPESHDIMSNASQSPDHNLPVPDMLPLHGDSLGGGLRRSKTRSTCHQKKRHHLLEARSARNNGQAPNPKLGQRNSKMTRTWLPASVANHTNGHFEMVQSSLRCLPTAASTPSDARATEIAPAVNSSSRWR